MRLYVATLYSPERFTAKIAAHAHSQKAALVVVRKRFKDWAVTGIEHVPGTICLVLDKEFRRGNA